MKVELDDTDAFEQVLAEILALNRRKRADYALDGDPWSNFRATADRCGMASPLDAVVFNIEQKLVRLTALKANGRQPANESVVDTWRDIATYAVIGNVLAGQDHRNNAAFVATITKPKPPGMPPYDSGPINKGFIL